MRQWLLGLCLAALVAVGGPGAADAAIKYVGAGATGSGNGSSTSNLCGGLADADCTPSAGDTIYLCGPFTAQIAPQAVNGSSGSPITYDFDCPGNPASLVFAATADQGVYINGRQWHVCLEEHSRRRSHRDWRG